MNSTFDGLSVTLLGGATMAKKQEKMVQLSIESLASGGDGIAHDDTGRVVFVPRTAPGDIVSAAIEEEKKSFARARIVKLLEAGPGRCVPPCSLFVSEKCGGCQWQHLELQTQQEWLLKEVRSALRNVIDEDTRVDLEDVKDDGYGWRRRTALSYYASGGAGGAVIGYKQKKSHRVVSVASCVQCTPSINKVIARMQEALSSELSGKGTIHIVEADDGQVAISIQGKVSEKGVEAVFEHPLVAGVRWPSGTRGVHRVVVDGLNIAAGDFAQASKAGNKTLHGFIEGYRSEWDQKNVLELYAGVGNLTREFHNAKQVTAIENAPLKFPKLENAAFIKKDASVYLSGLSKQTHFDWIVLDPPRVGAKDSIEFIPKLGLPNVMYISCNPATLARDLGMLCAHGYRCSDVKIINMMPQTSHVEVVAVMRPPR